MPEFPHQHITIPPDRRELQFKGNGRGKFDRRTNLSREQHAARLQRQLASVEQAFSDEQDRREQGTLDADDFCLLLNVVSAPGYPLKLDSLEKKPSKKHDGIYLLNVRYRETPRGRITEAAILVPFGQLKALASKIAAYADPSKDSTNKDGITSPSNADLVANIENIGVAALEALWTEPESLPTSKQPIWWELWVSRAPRAETATITWVELFEKTRSALGLEVNRFRIRLPDNEIVLVKATRSQLETSLDLLNTLTEIKMVRPCSVGLSDLPGPEQHEWIEVALDRIVHPGINAPAVCLLDTGVNRGHPLLEILLAEEDLDTVIPVFGNADHPNPLHAHGTPMAGIAAYDDLRTLMLDSGQWVQKHRLESVKIIHEGNEHAPENYGAVTQEAVARPETRYPRRPRVYCLAITQSSFPAKGQPSSWSAAIDSATAGGNGSSQKRLLFVSAGNHRDFLNNYQYPASNRRSPVENPAQAWNAVAVGAMTRRCVITEEDDESRRARPLVTQGPLLSPFSCTSKSWESHWPIKPDIVMEGGNIARTASGALVERESLEPITTASNFLSGRPLCNINATSSATASASRLGAILTDRMPGFWTETYRGLMVHSARWRPSMLGHIDPHAAGNSGRVQNLLRDYGFGEPDEPRLFGSGESGVTMLIQDSIQPYDPESEAGAAHLHHFHLHQLPWPQQVFDQHRDVKLTLRVTLSYFIEPSPGSRCWQRSRKYRYASHLLRFSFKRSTESDAAFRRALEKRIEEEDEEITDQTANGETRAPADSKWALGPRLRGKGGSLVQDVWEGSPAELAAMGQVAVYPAKGWFATRSFRPGHEFYECHKLPVRYSLIISIDAEQDIGLYTAVSNLVSVSA